MKKILAFSGSNSSRSINQKLLEWVIKLIKNQEVNTINLNDFPLPIFDIDLEESQGIPQKAYDLKEIFDRHEGFILAVPEHNSSMPSFFKNIIDWLSRIEKGFFREKPILLISTSPGPSGGRNVLPEVEKVVSGYLAGKVIGRLGFPKFFRIFQNHDEEVHLKDENLELEIKSLINKLENSLSK
ncbi:MAG: NAD(P)H-dependent oxidoreductase [Bacteroidota bacterium]|nr:NAD(P)H-dependent oxidoreductase [Bacteroidota bacterium]